MAHFRNDLGIVVEAIEFRGGEQPYELAADVIAGRIRYTEAGTMLMQFSDGVLLEVWPGDWITMSANGAKYAYNPDVFLKTHELIATMDFGQAIEVMKHGQRIARAGWNGKGMFLFYITRWTYTDGKQDNYPNLPFIAMKTAGNNVVPWLASQTDIVAGDWVTV